MRSLLTLIMLAVLVLVVGCLPTTPTEAGWGALALGLVCVLLGLWASFSLFKVEGEKPAAWFALGAGGLIGGGLMALGAWWLGWWGK